MKTTNTNKQTKSSALINVLFPEDGLLRLHGFKIHSRRGTKEPEWKKAGKVMLQSEAIALVTIEYDDSKCAGK